MVVDEDLLSGKISHEELKDKMGSGLVGASVVMRNTTSYISKPSVSMPASARAKQRMAQVDFNQ